MFISVIIPTYNDEEYIDKLLKSLENQTHRNFEVIVIDDKSTDNTVKVVKEFKNVKLLISGKHRITYSRNLGLKNAKGTIIVSLDSDCILENNYLEEVSKHFNNPKINGIITKEELILDTLIERIDWLRSYEKHGGWAQTIRAFRRNNIIYDEDLEFFAEDIFLSKIIKSGLIKCPHTKFYSHRFHSWKDVFNSWKRYPSSFVFYRKYETVLKGFIPLFFLLVSPFIALQKFVKYRDPVALMIPFYDLVRSVAYLYGIITNPKQMFKYK